MFGRKIKQINNLTISFYEPYNYCVFSPDGKCLEDRMTLEQAEKYCRKTKDFLKNKKVSYTVIKTVDNLYVIADKKGNPYIDNKYGLKYSTRKAAENVCKKINESWV